MRLELGANTKNEIDKSKGLFVYFNVPHDTPEIRQNIRGLILCLAKARYYVVNNEKDVGYKYTARALDGIEVHFMSDELLNRGVNSLIEIEFTLKHFLAQMADKKDIQFFIDKPAEPALLEDGSWDMTDNKSIETGRTSNLEVGSLLETNSITDVLKIAMLDDGTIGFPDINPFNLESKLDDIRTDINETKVHFTNDFTDLINWFASSFREGVWNPISLINNPIGKLTFYQMVLDTFNDTQKSYVSVTIPLWGTVSVPYWVKQHSFIDKMNQNFSTTFNEEFDANTDLAKNSYLRSLNTWLTVDWKAFSDYFLDIRDYLMGIDNSLKLTDNTGIATVVSDNMILANNNIIIVAKNIAGSFMSSVASNGLGNGSYFVDFNVWYTTTWLNFENIMAAIRDCICAIPTAFINGNGSSKLDDLKDTIKLGSDNTNTNLSGINTTISTLQLSPTINNNTVVTPSTVANTNTINVAPSNPTITVQPSTVNPTINNPITVQPCKPIIMCGNGSSTTTKPLQDIADQIKNLVDLTKDNGSDTVDNGDGTYTTTPKPTVPNPPVDHSQPPVDINKPINSVTGKPALLDPVTGKVLPYDPVTGKVINSTVNNPLEDGYTENPYYKNLIKPSTSHDAKCGFTYKMLIDTADYLEEMALYGAVAGNAAIAMGITAIDIANGVTTVATIIGTILSGGTGMPVAVSVNLIKAKGVDLVKQQGAKLTTMYVVDGSMATLYALSQTIRNNADEIACDSGMISNMNKTKIFTLLGTMLTGNPSAYFAYEALSDVWDYSNASDQFANIIDMNDYKAYCPCPLTGLFCGHFWNGVTGNGEKHLYLESDGVTVAGTSTSKDLFGSLYESEIVNGLIDVNNELAAGGTLHVTSHTGFPDSGFTMSTNIEGTEVYFGTPVQTFTRQ